MGRQRYLKPCHPDITNSLRHLNMTTSHMNFTKCNSIVENEVNEYTCGHTHTPGSSALPSAILIVLTITNSISIRVGIPGSKWTQWVYVWAHSYNGSSAMPSAIPSNYHALNRRVNITNSIGHLHITAYCIWSVIQSQSPISISIQRNVAKET